MRVRAALICIAWEGDHKVVFAGQDWDANAFDWAVAQRNLGDGMDCQVGQADPAPARGPKSVTGQPRFKALIHDPEEPGKGRDLNGLAGWRCELVSTKKLHAYGLKAHFTNLRPGTGAALDTAFVSAFKRKRPVLFDDRGPTWLPGQVGDPVVMLGEPPHYGVTWATPDLVEGPLGARRATACPLVEARIDDSKACLDRAPRSRALLRRDRTGAAHVSEAIVSMQRTEWRADDTARHFLKTHPELRTRWVPSEVAGRVRAAL